MGGGGVGMRVDRGGVPGLMRWLQLKRGVSAQAHPTPSQRTVGQGSRRSAQAQAPLLAAAAVADSDRPPPTSPCPAHAGAEFETIEAPLEEPVRGQYQEAAAMWNQLFREFIYAEEQVGGWVGGGQGHWGQDLGGQGPG